jgi:hypothetical protein
MSDLSHLDDESRSDLACIDSIQEVVPGVYLGGLEASNTISNLDKYNFKLVVRGRDLHEGMVVDYWEREYLYRPKRVRKAYAGRRIRQLNIDIDDNPRSKIRKWFARVRHMIERYRKRGRAVLVHCNAGISRSATLMVAYLIWRELECGTIWANGVVAVAETIDRLCQIRPIVNPNDGFEQELEEWAQCELDRRKAQRLREVSKKKAEDEKSCPDADKTTDSAVEL